MRRVIDVQLSHSVSVRRRTIKKDPKRFKVLEDASIVTDLWNMVCCMLHVTCYMQVASCELRIANCVLSADESIELAREDVKDNQLVSGQGQRSII